MRTYAVTVDTGEKRKKKNKSGLIFQRFIGPNVHQAEGSLV